MRVIAFSIFTLQLSLCSLAFSSEGTYWDASCNSDSITKIFGIPKTDVFNSGGFHSLDKIDGTIEMISPTKIEYIFFKKINAKVESFSRKSEAYSTSGQNTWVTCVNGKVSIYEFDLAGDPRAVLEKLGSKYGKIIKEEDVPSNNDSKYTYSLYEKHDQNYVFLIKSITPVMFQKEMSTKYSIVYLNPLEANKWLSKYASEINKEKQLEAVKTKKSTVEDLNKIK